MTVPRDRFAVCLQFPDESWSRPLGPYSTFEAAARELRVRPMFGQGILDLYTGKFTSRRCIETLAAIYVEATDENYEADAFDEWL